MQVIRQKTTQGGKLIFNFSVKGSKFLVKNFTEGYIKVAFDEEDKADILIPGNAAQICVISENSGYESYARDTVYVIAEQESEKGVEVQCLRW